MQVSEFVEKWRPSSAAERSNKDSFLRDLCDVLGVSHPDAAKGDPDRDRYIFEKDAVLIHDGSRHTIGKIDLYKQGCFILEAKQGSEAESKKIGHARRETPAWNIVMQEAFGQALGYATTIEPPPPFIIITDIGYCFDLYASFDGTRNYRKFPDAINSRISLAMLERDSTQIQTLRLIFTDPHALDPSKRAARVTREIAGHVATLARALEQQGHAPELVAKFLMRCLFTMFAEDAELLPKRIFAEALDRWMENPDAFPGEVADLWKTMNEGGSLFGAGKIWQFNGGLFADPIGLPLTKEQLIILSLAAKSNWADVEPAIFGTLLERALDPKERHRLGAHYTPRAYVERLVRPTIEEPLRAEWDNVRAQVMGLLSDVDPDKNIKVVAEARKIVSAFHERLTRIRVLDPACGSGNFLYVALDLFKRIENEVLDLLSNLGENRPLYAPSGRMVTPEQFLGIEIKPWAKEITELVLWIGWLQWQIRTRGWKAHPQEPILRDYHNIECRDAVLAYDSVQPLLDGDGEIVTRWDGRTMKLNAMTGETQPDERCRIPVLQYLNARPADWPDTEFLVANPPYIGTRKIRAALGDSYVEALRQAYPEVPETADLVLYWWHKAATLVEEGETTRFGMITTNSIVQEYARPVVDYHVRRGLRLKFAIARHPWPESVDAANVEVAMSVAGGASDAAAPVIGEVATSNPLTLTFRKVKEINPSFSDGPDIRALKSLKANESLCFQGVVPAGEGFKLTAEEAHSRFANAILAGVVRPYVIGQDLTKRRKDRYIIDFFGFSEEDVRARFPDLYQHLLDNVYAERLHNARRSYKEKWWLFAEPRPALRRALASLPRYIGTPYTAKFRPFVFLETDVIPDAMVYAIAVADPAVLAVLSSRVHAVFARRAGGLLESRPRYNSNLTFLPFPFPDSEHAQMTLLRRLGIELDSHRKRQAEAFPDLTLTAIYNVLEKVAAGATLVEKETEVHRQGLVSLLKRIHDDIDKAVIEAYRWPGGLTDDEILARLVTLNRERAEEETHGVVRWTRPDSWDFETAGQQQGILVESGLKGVDHQVTSEAKTPWPKTLPEQIAAVRELVAASNASTWTVAAVAASFHRAPRATVAVVLDSLAALGILMSFETPAGKQWRFAA